MVGKKHLGIYLVSGAKQITVQSVIATVILWPVFMLCNKLANVFTALALVLK